MPTMFSQINKLMPREGSPLPRGLSCDTGMAGLSLWVQLHLPSLHPPPPPPTLPSRQRTFFRHLVISGLLPDSEPGRAGCPESESLILDAKGIQSVLMNEGTRSKAGRGLTLLKAQGRRGCHPEWESVLPALRKRMLK